MEVVDDSYARTQYLNGEYRTLTEQASNCLFRAPATCDCQNYVSEAGGQWGAVVVRHVYGPEDVLVLGE